MLVTALSPLVEYENAAKIAKKAHAENISLKEAALAFEACSEGEFNNYIDPQKMI